MADHTANTSSGLFSRRPSFFGSKASKGHAKGSRVSLSYSSSSSRTAATPPPALTLPPVTTPDETPLVPSQYRDSPKVPSTPQRKQPTSRHSIASSVTDIGSSLRRSRSASLRTNTSAGTTSTSSHRRTPSATLALTYSPEKTPNAATSNGSRPTLSISTFSRSKQKSSDNVKPDGTANAQVYEKSPLSAVDKPKTPFAMAVPLSSRHAPSQKDMLQPNRQGTTQLAPSAPIPLPNVANPNVIFQHIQEMASKRISTLDYLRKAHEGRIYWFNTLLFSKSDLTRLPSSSPRNQARRATHYLLLGFSLPTILDLNANSPSDYLRALNALLLEFEQYQSIHPTDGSHPSSLSRARLPQMFKRANLGGKGRRSSSATGLSDYPLLTPSSSANSESSFGLDSPPENNDLLPNESYTHLQTPSLPFDPDFFSTFATLCDVLIDCYTRILSMLASPDSADARVRKIILAGVVREFEESCRAGLKSEVGGVGKVVLGGLM
ncbi:hypothetical protein DE146DRAFT_747622 [Phaeosphaeria sp. MPI-PUGE-AT-0046c]|nr:hypothetical protein DE146DRAFT_747622 [Phaeosphaeria sp. MPI-PUGE-AT-0046c]